MRQVLAVAAMVLLVTASVSFAQQKKKKGEDTTRSVAGVVTAADDQAIVGAVVQLKNLKSLQIRSFITQENGAYYFHELSPDVDYELKADESPSEVSTIEAQVAPETEAAPPAPPAEGEAPKTS